MIKAMLDTNVCIYLIKNSPPQVRQHFNAYVPGDLGISSITVAELKYGVQKSAQPAKNAKALEQFLLPLIVLPFDDVAACEYGKIRADLERKGTPIGSMDMLIAAHAKALNCKLITHNLREFTRVPNLQCETWIN